MRLNLGLAVAADLDVDFDVRFTGGGFYPPRHRASIECAKNRA